MPTLMIYNLDSNGDPVTTLELGEHVFGRGPLLKCMDRRVSRYHGIIKVTGDGATITSTHTNPCFYQSSYSTKIIILPQNDPVRITDGDKFALLADQFWFRVSIRKDTDQGTSSNCESETITNALDGIDEERNIDSDHSSNSMDLLQATQQADTTNNDNIQSHINAGDGAQVTLKRDNEDDVEPSSSKKPKLENEGDENGADANELLSVLGDLKGKELLSDSDGESKGQGGSKAVMSDSDSDDNIVVKIKPGSPKRSRKKPTVKNEPLSSAALAERDAELKAMLFSSDDDNDDIKEKSVKLEPKKENQAGCSSKTDPVVKDSNDNNRTNTAGSKETNKGGNGENKTDSCDADAGNSPNADQDTNVAGPSSSDRKRQFRDHCWYGLGCYRKSNSHLAEYSHPGDSDYETDPNDDRPVCSFGAACYRRNKDHRRAYKHPNKPTKPSPKRTKNKAKTTGVPKKRTARKKYNESSEDDYDLEDPFIDSGTEYEATTSSNDSDSDYSEGSEEATKRMLKEAKRFTKGGKKDKDDD